ncbi:MAG: c-type cytochrome biosis protein CcsB, partial [Ramlibacter sp.]|nr:c-type cytochrome biosis protein CcsB [Ramlibacter sp.]
MTTATTTTADDLTITLDQGYLARRTAFDWVFAAIVAAGGLYAFVRYAQYMDVYEKGILLAAIPATIWLAWFWPSLRVLLLVVSGFALLAIFSYQGELARADSVFWLKYFLSSQSAILWMSMLFFMSTLFYWFGIVARGQSATMQAIGSRMAWVAVGMALIGTLVRWYES